MHLLLILVFLFRFYLHFNFYLLKIRAIACNFWLAFLHSLEKCLLNVRKRSVFIPSNSSDLLVFVIKSFKFKLTCSFDLKRK